MIKNPPWNGGVALLEFPPLAGPTESDVCVVGAGISGITTAYLLAREGLRVTVLDDGPVGGGETGATSAHLCNVLDDRYLEIERHHGVEGSRAAAESHTTAIAEIGRIVLSEGIECDFRRVSGYLFEPPGRDPTRLDRELAAAHRAGLAGVERVTVTPLPFVTGPALRFPDQAEFEPMKYLHSLAGRLDRMGVKIHTSTHVCEIEGKGPYRVKAASGHTVFARSVVMATNSPVHLRVSVHTKQAAYRTYVIGISIPKGLVSPALYWDDDDPYHYLRVVAGADAGSDLLLVGGEDHRTGEPPARDPFSVLESWIRERLPGAGAVRHAWSGQVMQPVDGLAFIGRSPGDDGVYLITGDSGNGLTHGTLGAMLIRDLICGRPNPWEKLYSPSRITPSSGVNFVRENLNTVGQYLDLVTSGEVKTAAEIAPGDGAILREGWRKIACHRDSSGTLHTFSAVCPHLGGVVRWNAEKKSWDCPCHGSRFDPMGRVINGPANADLERMA